MSCSDIVMGNINDLIRTVHDENREIEALLEHLEDIVSRKQFRVLGRDAVINLIDFCADHIGNENRVMIKSGYSGLSRHTMDHSRLFQHLSIGLSNCDSYSEAEWESFTSRLLIIYKYHTDNHDNPLTDFLLSNSINSAADNIKLSNGFDCRIDKVKKQHDELEVLLTMLDKAATRESPLTVRLPVLGLLVKQSTAHIQCEESLMKSAAYIHYEEHALDHNHILNLMSVAIEECEHFGQIDWIDLSKALRDIYFEHKDKHDSPLFKTLIRT